MPKQPSAPDGIMRQEQAIHLSNIMLLDPETQYVFFRMQTDNFQWWITELIVFKFYLIRRPTKIDRRRVEKQTKDGRKVVKWTRFVHGTDIEIPKPGKRYDDVRSGK